MSNALMGSAFSAAGSRKAGVTVSGLATAFVCVAVSIEYQIPGSARTLMSEFAVIIGFLALALKGPLLVRPALAVFLIALALSAFPLGTYQNFAVYMPYVKMLVIFMGALIFWDTLFAVYGHQEQALLWIMRVGCLVAAYSVVQSLLGFGVLPDAYSLGGAPALIQENFRTIDADANKLVGVMRWKAAQINNSLGFHALQGLGYGLHWFSANMAEYLVFVSAAAYAYFKHYRPKRAVALAAIQLLIGAAIFLSGSRFSFSGFLLVNSAFVWAFSRHKFFMLIGGSAIISAALLLVDWKIIFFDDGGSLEGRNNLNDAAMSFIFENNYAIFLGGDAPAFLRSAYSNVHSTFLYLWLFGGLVAAVLLSLVFIGWTWKSLLKALRRDENVALHLASLMSFTWFGLYGLTWASVSLQNTVILVAMFAALSRWPGKQDRRSVSIIRRSSRLNSHAAARTSDPQVEAS